MHHKAVTIVSLIVESLIICSSQGIDKLADNPCTSYTTCGQCLSSPGCAWCLSDEFTAGMSRCDVYDNLNTKKCSHADIFNPKSSQIITKSESASEDEPVQITPQEIALRLRTNEPVAFNITFYQAPDYPVDLYYLMDLTFSMKEHKEKVADLADELAESLRNITKNFRMGFGSFIDKVVMPYADMEPSRLQNPCRDFVCVPPYGYKNHLPLDRNVSKFMNEVGKASLSGNLDNAEGGFDAIMQAVVCRDAVKWNIYSRKILLFATDSIFHYAGDGKLGGIVDRNDESCHLDSSGLYTESVHQDYPSLSQLSRKIRSNNVNLIFAVPEERLGLYTVLSEHIEGSSTSKLSSDSSNIVDLIKDKYEAISSEIVLSDNASHPIQIKYTSKCHGTKAELTNTCSGLKIGDTVTFEVKVELTSCPKDQKDWKQKILISPVGLTETVTLDLDLMCACDCDNEQIQEAKSEKCSKNGTYSCGICKCDPNHFGKLCQCFGDDVIRADMLQHCKKGESGVCSGRGDCVCGKCDCYPGPRHGEEIYGEFCECDTFSCERDYEGRICGGAERGRCCGKCLCEKGWTGTACDCPTDTSTCVDPSQPLTEICSGHGKCQCGQCQCTKDHNGRYGGTYCEDSSTSGEGFCTRFMGCVQCKAFKTGSLSEEECDNCSISVTVVDVLVDSPEERNCQFKDDSQCIFYFQYSYDSKNQPVIRCKEEKDCPTVSEIEVIWIIVGVVCSVLAIGIVVILVAKLAIHLKDLKDYKAFVEETKRTQFAKEENPIFKAAVSNFQNPMYTPTSKSPESSAFE